jgi:hypothetical protein
VRYPDIGKILSRTEYWGVDLADRIAEPIGIESVLFTEFARKLHPPPVPCSGDLSGNTSPEDRKRLNSPAKTGVRKAGE